MATGRRRAGPLTACGAASQETTGFQEKGETMQSTRALGSPGALKALDIASAFIDAMNAERRTPKRIMSARPARSSRLPRQALPSGHEPRPGCRRARLSLVSALALLIGALSQFVAAPAHSDTLAISDTLVSNIGQTTGGATAGVGTWVNAQDFTTGSNAGGYMLSSIEAATPSAATNGQRATIRAELWSAATGGGPGRKIGNSLTVPSTVSAGTVSFTAPPNTVLLASTTYYLVVYTVGGYNLEQRTTTSDDEDSGSRTGWSIGNTSWYCPVDTPTTTGCTWTEDTATGSIRIAVKGAEDHVLTLLAKMIDNPNHCNRHRPLYPVLCTLSDKLRGKDTIVTDDPDFCRHFPEQCTGYTAQATGNRPDQPVNQGSTANAPQAFQRPKDTEPQQQQQTAPPPPLHADLISDMNDWRNDPQWVSYQAHTDRWDRTLLTFGEPVSGTLPRMTATEAQGYADRGWTRWVGVAAALQTIVTGTSSAETLTGTDSGELLVGLGGDDTLNGQGGNDELRGGAGNDDLSGGGGNDRFVFFSSQTGANAITDFGTGDVIVLLGSGWSSVSDIVDTPQAVGSTGYRYTLAPGLTVETTNNRTLRTEDFVTD